MWERLRSIWTVPDLRNKILFTLGILLLTRVLANIPVPLTQTEQLALRALFSNPNSNGNLGQIFGLLDVFSGGNLQHFSIIAMGVYPYITATIVMQLLQPIIPALQNLSQEGEAGRLRFSQITRMIAVPLAFLQALGQVALFVNANVLDPNTFNLLGPQWLQTLAILMTLTAGTIILVWLGELITENGIGNGVSLIIFGGIVSRIPSFVQQGLCAVHTDLPGRTGTLPVCKSHPLAARFFTVGGDLPGQPLTVVVRGCLWRVGSHVHLLLRDRVVAATEHP